MLNRKILHIDMNAFFASVEQAADPALRGKPIVVGGGIEKSSVVAAASYEAKAFGVKSGMSTWDARKLCPELIIVIGDMNKYIHTSREIVKMLTRYTDLVEVFSIDEAFVDVTETRDRFGGEIAIAKAVKHWIREKFKITCNIGIGPNKLMAKLAGELKKPDALIILSPRDIPFKIENVKVSELCGVGEKLESYLAELGIRTFGELNRYPREELVKRFGIHSYTLPKFTSDIGEVKGYLLRLSEQVGRRLRRDGYRGNVVHAALGFGDFKFFGKQKKIEDYIDDGYEIFRLAEGMLPGCNDPIRFVGVSVSGLTHNLDQISLFPEKEASKKALKAIDEINDRFGEFTIERAAIMKTVLRGKTGMVTPRVYKVSR
ncbi:MAG: DNA polymerase IV [Candidatus Saganbacteria bacterium]|nr:DNA polymerase IV [Candidatus Saganbacteria bacterium]